MLALTKGRLDWRGPEASEKKCVDTHGEAVGLARPPSVWDAVRRHSRKSGWVGEFPGRLRAGAATLTEMRLDWLVAQASGMRCVDTHREAIGLASSPGV